MQVTHAINNIYKLISFLKEFEEEAMSDIANMDKIFEEEAMSDIPNMDKIFEEEAMCDIPNMDKIVMDEDIIIKQACQS